MRSEGNHVAIAIYKYLSLSLSPGLLSELHVFLERETKKHWFISWELQNWEWDRRPARSVATISHLRCFLSAIPASVKVAFCTLSFPPLSTISLLQLVLPFSNSIDYVPSLYLLLICSVASEITWLSWLFVLHCASSSRFRFVHLNFNGESRGVGDFRLRKV